MLRMTFFALLTSFVVILASCSKKSDLPVVLELKYDQWSNGPGLKMQLSGEIQDSRCPINELMDIDCVWQGFAQGIVSAEISGNIHAIPYTIMGLCDTSTDTCGTVVDTLGYHFRFISLDPYPDALTPPQQSDFLLTVEVEKK